MPIREPHTNVTLTENVTKVDVDKVSGELSLSITQDNTVLQIRGVAISESNASQIAIQPVSTLTASNIQDALQQLADQNFRGASAPADGSANLSEGDFFYDTDDDQLKVYRETSTGTFEFVPIIVGEASSDSDTLDAGAF